MLQIVSIKPRGKLINAQQVQRAIGFALNDMVAEGTRFMAEYPPVQPGQRYIRTGTLKRSWNMLPATRQGNNLVASVGSASSIAPYNRKVQGVDQDPFFRRRGWRDVDTLVQRIRTQLPPRVQRAIDTVVRQSGGMG